ncbi:MULTISPECIES: GNAT family N-acetyltransferase [Aeromonas]|uniref:GNAT family N-acetyltransferase n=1 Tax=Aeromonas TaxID=642 RepID=UPI00051B7D1E|nr:MULTISPECIES: GNAT family N-acetyltransferase [Aeromonas]MCH7370658.1 GNAT family N-acetyltransferase [Aeromonas sp. MR16]
MNIRKATEQDIDAILELNRQIGLIHFEQAPEVFCPPSSQERVFLLGAIGCEERLFCVAVDSERVLGFLTARIEINEAVPFLSKLPICRIGSVVVDEDHRSRGIGKALMAHCDDWAKAHDASQIRLEVMSFNERAKSLYESLGFTRQSEIYAR